MASDHDNDAGDPDRDAIPGPSRGRKTRATISQGKQRVPPVVADSPEDDEAEDEDVFSSGGSGDDSDESEYKPRRVYTRRT